VIVAGGVTYHHPLTVTGVEVLHIKEHTSLFSKSYSGVWLNNYGYLNSYTRPIILATECSHFLLHVLSKRMKLIDLGSYSFGPNKTITNVCVKFL